MRTRSDANLCHHRSDAIDEVSVQSTARVTLNNGCTVEIRTPIHRGVDENAERRITEIKFQQQGVLNDALSRLGLEAPRERADGDRPDAEATKNALADTCPGTDKVFELIDRLDRRGLVWARHPELGFRASIYGEPPEIERLASGDAFEWADEGLCPFAAAIELQEDTGADEPDEWNAETAQARPMEAARREHARCAGLDEVPATLTGESAAWGLLVVASDNGDVDQWIVEQGLDRSPEARKMFVRTLNAITTRMIAVLDPGPPAVAIREKSAIHA